VARRDGGEGPRIVVEAGEVVEPRGLQDSVEVATHPAHTVEEPRRAKQHGTVVASQQGQLAAVGASSSVNRIRQKRGSALSAYTPCLLAATGPILCTSSGSTDSAGSPLVSVRAPTFAVSRTGPRVEGEPRRRNPGLMRWPRLENV
jgi:hypothetical protein